jgi:hypothetical protein
MSGVPPSVIAGALVRLLVDADPEYLPESEGDWLELLRIATDNVVAVRTLDRLRARGVDAPVFVRTGVEAQRERTAAMLATVSRVGDLYDAHEIPWCLPKALPTPCEMGRDIDVLVLARGRDLAALIGRELGATPDPPTFRSGLTAATVYRVPGCPAPLEVHDGRLGLVGEHDRYPAALLGRCRVVEVGCGSIRVPRDEDLVVLQGIQRVYGRSAIRITDVVTAIALARRAALDWDAVLRTSRTFGSGPGLSCYLSYIDRIHHDLFGAPLPCAPAVRSILRSHWGRLSFPNDRYRFPVITVNCRLYAERLASDLAHGRWSSAGRLCLLPVVAAAAAHARRRFPLTSRSNGASAGGRGVNPRTRRSVSDPISSGSAP